MIAAPFFQVKFADFWLADQLNSLVIALLDFQYLACFYVVNGNWLEAGSKYYTNILRNINSNQILRLNGKQKIIIICIAY